MDGKKYIDGALPTALGKILLIVDRDDWCYFKIASQIKKHLSKKYNFTIVNELEFIQNRFLFTNDNYDLYLFLSWTTTRVLDDTKIDKKKIICGIYDYLSWQHYTDIFNKIKDIHCFFVANTELVGLLGKVVDIPIYECEDGVDTDFFKYVKRFDKKFKHRNFIVGWAGNASWGNYYNKPTSKGYEFIKKAVEELQSEGENVELHTADRDVKWRNHREMYDEFYTYIDCYICASECEGTPNPILESLSCGHTVITTNIGIVPQIKNHEDKLLIWDRSIGVDDLKKKIIIMKNNYNNYNRENLRKNMKSEWDWSIKTKNFEKMIDNYFNK